MHRGRGYLVPPDFSYDIGMILKPTSHLGTVNIANGTCRRFMTCFQFIRIFMTGGSRVYGNPI